MVQGQGPRIRKVMYTEQCYTATEVSPTVVMIVTDEPPHTYTLPDTRDRYIRRHPMTHEGNGDVTMPHDVNDHIP